MTTVFRPGRRRIVGGTRTVMLAAASLMPPLASRHAYPRPGRGRGSSARHPEPDVGAGRPDLDAIHEQPHNPRLLRREQLIPERLEPGERVARLRVAQVRRLGPRRQPGAYHDLV